MMLKQFLISNANARRIFGKKEIEIILKQLDGIILKQSEKNRLSRDIKQKLEFIKEISQFKNEFRLKKNQNNNELIKRAVDTILKDESMSEIQSILLFGSFADKTFTPSSDIDICVVFNKDISLKEATKFRIRISGKLPENVDVQVFNALPQKIKREIAKNHKVIYRNENFDNMNFSIRYLKDEDYFLRMKKIFGLENGKDS